MESEQSIRYGDLLGGTAVDRAYVITPEVYGNFLKAFDDRCPIHVDAEFSRAQGFEDIVMHGAILNGFLSHFVGMVLPGSNSLLLSVELRYSQPSYLGDRLRLRAIIAQKVDAQKVVLLHVTFFNETRGIQAAAGRVQVKVSDL